MDSTTTAKKTSHLSKKAKKYDFFLPFSLLLFGRSFQSGQAPQTQNGRHLRTGTGHGWTETGQGGIGNRGGGTGNGQGGTGKGQGGTGNGHRW